MSWCLSCLRITRSPRDRDFWNTVEAGVEAATMPAVSSFLVSSPTARKPAYGYIEVGSADGVGNARCGAFRREAEREDRQGISGIRGISSGMPGFSSSAPALCAMPSRHMLPDIWDKALLLRLIRRTPTFPVPYLPHDLYAAVPSISVDYAIMEHASDIALVPATFRWNDLGSWQSLLEVGSVDGNGNVIVGDVVAIDCEHSYLRSDGRSAYRQLVCATPP